MADQKQRVKKARLLEKGLQESLAQQRAGQVFGPFEDPNEAMKFLYSAQDLLICMEKALRQAAQLGRLYDPNRVRWLLDVEDKALQKKLKQLTS